MKLRFPLLLLLVACAARVVAEENIDQAMERAALEYAERVKQAGAELNATRERVAREKAPLLSAQRAAEDRLLAAESELARLETTEAEAANHRRRLAKDAESLHKNGSYLVTLAQEGLKGYADSLLPGEDQIQGAAEKELEAGFGSTSVAGSRQAVAVADFLLARVKQSLGGYSAPGRALPDGGNAVVPGTLAFVGPQAFFHPDTGTPGVLARVREGSAFPVSFPVKDWNQAAADAFFRGAAGEFPADATGGKALRLRQTTGTLWQHIEKGGYVAFAILGVGLLSLSLMVLKLWDLSRLLVESDAGVAAFLQRVGAGGDAAGALPALRASTRELFAAGLAYLDRPKAALEEHLQAILLRQRLHAERRLPLLAVIATAAPLMGLLGTVVGMVKTFALINVFGTGNAAKLASGISEVLVATELGLAVAIPTLVVHGFLSQRIHKQLATLERQALEFVTAAKSGRAEAAP